MASSGQPGIEQKLALLQSEFKRTLPNKLADIENAWTSVLDAKDNENDLEYCHRLVHTLAGSGGTFGATLVTTASREIIQAINSIEEKNDISQDIKTIISDLIVKLKTVANNWQPSVIPYFQPLDETNNRERQGNLIYLADDDELVANDLIAKLERDDFEVKYFSSLNAFENAIKEKMPSAIIMDVMFKEGDIAGIDSIIKLRNQYENSPPVIFISVRHDIEARLAAAKTGAQRYFSKPLDINKLSKTLDGLIERVETKPYRILFADDDLNLLKFYETVVLGAGMEVKTISNPLQILDVVNEFKPDVVVLDVYMPGYTGPELAQVIRQDDKWALTPIMFLSTETDLDVQLDSMNLGGEMFMVKPIAANHLISVLNSKAKSSRWSNRLNQDLENVIRENQYQIVTSNQHDIVSTADVTGRIIEVNEKFCEISGYSRKELLGQNHRLLKSTHHSDSFYKDMWCTIANGEVWHGTICNLNKEGDEYWVDSTIVPFLDENGKPYKYVSARTDVTTVIQSEERLERSQMFANIGTWDWNIATGSLYWSDRIWPLFGYEKELTDTTYENFMAAIHPDDRAFVGEAVGNCVEKNEEYNVEHRVVWPDGSIHWLHEKGDVARDGNGAPLHMLGVVQDITARKKTEMELAKQERQLLEAQSMARVGNWEADLLSGDLAWSDEIYRIFGYEPGSFKPSVKAFHQAIHPDDLTTVIESEKNAEATGKHDVEHRILQPDGTVRYVHELAKAEVDEEGNLIKMSGTVQDITDRKLAEQSIISAREEAETANRAKSEFLSSMSHELRTPMNAIMVFGQLLKMDFVNPLSDDQNENVSEILKASDHLLELINEVLDLARIEAGRIDLSIEDVQAGRVIVESLQLILPLAEKRGVTIKLLRGDSEISVSDLSTEQSIVRADHTRMKQVIINLLSNAVKYNVENGNITITCSKSENKNLRISITDSGLGIPKEQSEHLFTAFNRLGAETTDVEGTGIGLVITKNIVELMGGSIGYESNNGAGSTFWFELPAGSNTFENEDEESPSSPEIKIDLEEGRTVLYIEDNPANLRLVTQLLGRLPNIHMWSAHEPKLGLELAIQHRPDLILLDINLPGMDGYEVLKILKQHDETSGSRVIAISANAMPRDIEKGLNAGFIDYITKPIDISAFLATIDEHLKDK